MLDPSIEFFYRVPAIEYVLARARSRTPYSVGSGAGVAPAFSDAEAIAERSNIAAV
jgi:hypothetical protein